MPVSTKYFPFVKGLDQTTDDRLLEPGRPRAIENLVIAKKGRLAMRLDYDSLAMTVQVPADGALSLFDLATYDGRLIGIGEQNSGKFTPLCAIDVFTYEGRPQFGWRTTAPVIGKSLPVCTHLRNLGQVGQFDATITGFDVAAGGGLVCTVTKGGTGTVVKVHVFDPVTDSTVLYEELSTAATVDATPRVVCVGTRFFIGFIDTTVPRLLRFDPAVDTALFALPNPAAAGAAVTCFDMSLAHEGTTFWMAYGRTGPTTRVHGFDAAGTETHDFAGPAVLCDAITVFTEATLVAVGRINLACVINGTGAVNMSTYLVATSALQTNTPALFSGAISQVGMSINGTVLVPNVLVVYGKTFAGATGIAFEAFTSSSHATAGTGAVHTATMNSKLLTSKTRPTFSAFVTEALDGSATHQLYDMMTMNAAQPARPSATTDRLLAVASPAFALPNLAFDALTGLLYWPRLVTASAGNSKIVVSELAIAAQARRQTSQLGDTLYLGGATLCAFDGRNTTECSFLDRPRILSASVAGGGALTLLGVYQFVAVFETFDAKGNRIQSAPSDVFTGTLTGANNAFNVTVTGAHTRHAAVNINIVNNPSVPQAAPRLVLYRTQNTALGNLTFYRDVVVSALVTSLGQQATFGSIQSDAALSANEVLYTQGARGAQSGPLAFLSPEPCSSLAASADRVLSAGLPNVASFQEGRPLLVGEQSNWSDSIGFFRAARAQLLAVARLDERRIVWTETEMFEIDGPGLDDNGIGDIGAPRRLPSDVGLFGGKLGWRSVVECSLGILFQGLVNQIYLLPRGGTTPQPVGMAVQDLLAAFPTITAAVYLATDQTVRFTCNNLANSDSLFLLYDLIQDAWITEGPFGVTTLAAVAYQGRMTALQNNVVRQQRVAHPPAALIANAWRSGTLHPFGLGQFGRVLCYQFYGEYQADCALTCRLTFDDLVTEVLGPVPVQAFSAFGVETALTGGSSFANSTVLASVNTQARTLTAGQPYSFKFTPNQMKCESVRVDFEVTAPFPDIIEFHSNSQLTAANAIDITLATGRLAGDRVVVFIGIQNFGAGPPTAAGWTSVRTQIAGSVRGTCLERVLDGSEVSPVNFAYTGTPSAAMATSYTIRNSHPTAPSESQFSAVSSGTSTGSVAVAPTWGLKPTLWLSTLFLDDVAVSSASASVTSIPAGFTRGPAVAQTSGTPELSGATASAHVLRQATFLAGTAWSWTQTAGGLAFEVAVRPSDTVPSAGLVYHYWAMDIEDAGKSALKGPLQMG